GLVDPTAEPLQLLLALLGRAALARGVLGLPPQLLELFAGLALALLLAAQAVDVFLQPLQPALVLLLLLRGLGLLLLLATQAALGLVELAVGIALLLGRLLQAALGLLQSLL